LSTATHDQNTVNGTPVVKVYPNPFVARTTIDFESYGGFVRLQVFNNQGALIKSLVNNDLIKGKYTMDLDLEGHASGTYYVRWENGPLQQVKGMLKVE
jgi:hypothetical protein